MAHKSKRKHVKHMHEHEHHEAHHEHHRAASFRELGRALIHRIYLRATRRPRALFEKLSGLYSRASA